MHQYLEGHLNDLQIMEKLFCPYGEGPECSAPSGWHGQEAKMHSAVWPTSHVRGTSEPFRNK